jgi:hypothetical protein
MAAPPQPFGQTISHYRIDPVEFQPLFQTQREVQRQFASTVCVPGIVHILEHAGTNRVIRGTTYRCVPILNASIQDLVSYYVAVLTICFVQNIQVASVRAARRKLVRLFQETELQELLRLPSVKLLVVTGSQAIPDPPAVVVINRHL